VSGDLSENPEDVSLFGLQVDELADQMLVAANEMIASLAENPVETHASA
jgi:hypothetical protein